MDITEPCGCISRCPRHHAAEAMIEALRYAEHRLRADPSKWDRGFYEIIAEALGQAEGRIKETRPPDV